VAVEQGQKCFVVELADAVRETRSDSGGRFRESRRVPLITASTVSSDEATDFILEPATRIRDYDVVLTAPSLGVGVDISRAANSKLVDFVFGSSNHFEIDQKGIVDKRELAEFLRINAGPRRDAEDHSGQLIFDLRTWLRLGLNRTGPTL
jgi:hypothetical protein